MGLASIEQQLAGIKARLAVLNPLRVRQGLQPLAAPAEPKLDRNDYRHYEDRKHAAKVRLRNYRLDLDRQIKSYGTLLPTSTAPANSRGIPAQSLTPATPRAPATPRPTATANVPAQSGSAPGPDWLPAAILLIVLLLLWRKTT